MDQQHAGTQWQQRPKNRDDGSLWADRLEHSKVEVHPALKYHQRHAKDASKVPEICVGHKVRHVGPEEDANNNLSDDRTDTKNPARAADEVERDQEDGNADERVEVDPRHIYVARLHAHRISIRRATANCSRAQLSSLFGTSTCSEDRTPDSTISFN